MELGDLTVEVPCHEILAGQLHTMHLRLDVAPWVVSAPLSPERATKVFRRAQDLVSCLGSSGVSLPALRVLAGRDEGMGAAVGNGIMAFAGAIGAVCSDAADLSMLRDLVEKVG